MAKRNSVNLDITNNADGFDISGGTTPRKLTVTGGDVTVTGSGSATITFPSSSGTLYATGNTDVALADGGTGASLSDPGADRVMFWDDSGSTVNWLEVGSGLSITGTTLSASATTPKQPYDYIVYKNGSDTVAYKTSDGSTLSTNTDASVVLQACVDAIDASTGTGGRIYVQPGTYDMNTVVTIQGDNTSNAKAVALHGSGQQTTIFKPAVNVKGFTISNRAKVSLCNFAIIVRGSGDGIHSTNSSVGQRAFWQSEFRNIYIYDDASSTAHSGWGMNLGNPFRSVFENIEMNQVKNGLKLEALDTSTNYNPGDCKFTRFFIELASGSANGVAIQLLSDSTGDMNQMNFDMVEMIGTGTGQTAILLSGTSGSNNHNRFTGINAEEFDTILDIQKGRGNTFEFNYIITRDTTGTTYFKTSSTAYDNRVAQCSYLDTYTQNVTIVNDANTIAGQRNRFENIILQGSATAYTFTRVDATYLYNIFDNISGGSGINENATSSVSANAVTINATAGSFTDTTDINADTTRTAITLTNQAIRSSSVVSVFMMSTPDTNAMLVASATPADGSATITVRNVGTGNQTATYTLGFIVQQ